ncbi:MAG: flagellar biosynthesis anti-sigma factor FlgM [Negativicutes bacterium]|nr:flagellar biosynthesis anti-sigma factor FlgM [Negativicutes bacterium]
MINQTGKISGVAAIYGEQARVGKVRGKQGGYTMGKDEVSLSSEAQAMNSVDRALRNSQEIRTEKVRTIAENIAAGKYEVSAREIADKLVAYWSKAIV